MFFNLISSRALRLSGFGRFFSCFVFLAGLLFGLPCAYAQTGQGSVTGLVKDQQDAIIKGAVVTVKSLDTGTTQTTRTNSSGRYGVPALNPGPYTVTIAAPGFQSLQVDQVTISTSQESTVDAALKIGSETSVVTVTSEEALLTRDTSDVTTTVDHAIVQDLPYPERSALEAALLAPGVNGDPLNPGGIATENPGAFLNNVTPGSTITIGGGAPGTSSIYVDGSDVTQASYPRAGLNLSNRQVNETTVIATGLSARYGRTSSGVIVQTSTPGKNEYHGAVTWRHNDPWFNAFPLGSSAASNNHETYLGGYFGGPVWIPHLYNGHNKTFFFASYEPARLRTSSSFRGIFFTPDELTGKLNNSLALLNQTILKSSGAAAALAAPRSFNIYYQTPINAQGFPDGGQYTSSGSYTAIPNNDVSAQLAKNATAKAVLALMPTPSNPGPYVKFDRPDGLWLNDGTNAVYQRGALNHDNRYSVRIDHQFGERNRIFGRYTNVPLQNLRYFALDANNPLTATPGDSAYTKDIAFGYTRVLSNSVVNDFRYSYLRVVQQRIAPPSAQTQDYAAALGLTPSVTGKGFPSLGTFNGNGITYSLQGTGVTTSNPIGSQRDQNFVVTDNVTWTKGNHSIQLGLDIRWIQSNQYDLSGLSGGKYSFSQSQSNNGSAGGLGLATFMLGTISSFTNTPESVPGYYRWKYYAGYVQDDWRVLPNLTLNIGLRYELETPRAEAKNNQGFIRLDTPGTIGSYAATAAFCFADGCGGHKTMFPTNYMGFEPRIGFSYAPTPRSTIRASYGMMRTPLTGFENTPDPNFNVSSTSVSFNSGGTNPSKVTNYITNPVGALSSPFSALNGSRGPFYYLQGLPVVYVEQTSAVPYTQTYSMTAQYQLTSRSLFQATYQGLKGTHLVAPFTRPLNTPTLATIQSAITNKANLSGQINNLAGVTQSGSVLKETNLQALNPYQNYFNQSMLELYPRHGSSSYNGVYLNFNQRLSKGLSLIANYTWQKSLDNVPETNNGTTGGFPVPTQQNPYDLSSDYAVATFDQPSLFRYGMTYTLPFGPNGYLGNHGWLLNAVLGDITISGIGSNASGFPNSIALGSNGNFYSVSPAGVTTNGAACAPTGTNKYCVAAALPTGYTLRPNLVRGVPLINPDWKKNPFSSASPITPYLNPAAFAVPGDPGKATAGVAPTAALGNAPRTLSGGRTPREGFLDLRFSKGIRIHDRYKLSVNATFNNAFNHPVYYSVANRTTDLVTTSTVDGSIVHTPVANFGTLSQSNTASLSRVVRLGAEFTF